MEAGVEKEEEDHPQRQWEKHALLLVPMTAAGAILYVYYSCNWQVDKLATILDGACKERYIHIYI